MRKLLVIFGLILTCANLGLAQDHPPGTPGNSANAERDRDDRDDHDDNGPIQTGYAVVTPLAATTSATTSGLVVFASFGMRHYGGNGDATQAGVLPPDQFDEITRRKAAGEAPVMRPGGGLPAGGHEHHHPAPAPAAAEPKKPGAGGAQ